MTRASHLWLAATTMLVSCGGVGSPPPAEGVSPPPDGGAQAADAVSRPANEIRSEKTRNLAPVVGLDDAAQLAADNLAFGLDLYGQLRARGAGNIVFSQTSISLALAMLYGGAAGGTAAQMATALHFTLPPERLHPAFDALDLALLTPPVGADASAFRLAIANSTWVQKGFAFLPSYLDLLAENYDAGLFTEDFSAAPESARADINRWVSEQTENLIPELLDPESIDARTRLVLANAVYFHGIWWDGFSPVSPDGVFHAPGGDVTVPMMSNPKDNAILWGDVGWTCARLSYNGGTTSMIVLVPDAGTFDAFERGLTASSLAGILAPSSTIWGRLSMPRFKFSTALLLAPVLEQLGMTDAFDAALADFSGMDGARDLSVSEVVHQAVIAVDEQGTTAAAATGTTGLVTIVIDTPGQLFVVDRPFLFFIRHNPTGAILFQGRVVDPSR
ncbi:MAG: serpin family protein [Deltaproteobacteria bacterium]|nr:serpin family protein [Deltaproteobacteria bacterium]